MRPKLALALLLMTFGIVGCAVEPSDPEGTPILTINEITRGGGVPIVFTTDRTQTPERTTCADGSLPDLVAGSFDGPEAWNRYYVLEPGQTEAQFLMGIRSRSGVSFWAVTVGPAFEVIDPPTGPRNRLGDGSTLFSFDFGSEFFNPTIRSMTLRLRDGADPNSAEAQIFVNITTGGGRTLPRDDQSWTLIAGC